MIAVDETPVAIWFEGPDWVVAEKPAGMAFTPQNPTQHGTLVNALLGSNRWLHEMEQSLAPGVIHRLREQDQGLSIVAKNEEGAGLLSQAKRAQELRFRYRVRIPVDAEPAEDPEIRIYGGQSYGDTRVLDIESAIGDSAELAQNWLGSSAANSRFTCYAIEWPHLGGRRLAQTGRRVLLPQLDLYTAPP